MFSKEVSINVDNEQKISLADFNTFCLSTCGQDILNKTDLKKESFLEKGSYGQVLNNHENEANTVVKIYGKRAMKQPEIMLREAAMCSIPSHKNVIQTLSCLKINAETHYFYGLKLEYAPMDLLMYFKQEKIDSTNILPAEKLESFISDIFEGLIHLHEYGVSHNDLKLENILIRDNNLKICDFGFAHSESWEIRGIPFGSLRRRNNGLYEYFGSPVNIPSYNDTIGRLAHFRDEWAFGCIIFALSYGFMLYHDYADIQHKIFKVGHGKKYPNFADIYSSSNIKMRWTEPLMKLFISENPVSILEAAKKFEI